jgi:mitogen-activated protein kinase 1/3
MAQDADKGSSASVSKPDDAAAASSRHATELLLAQSSLDAYAVPECTGRFTILKGIGKGAYGAVYVALERGAGIPSGGRKVALKHIVNGFVSTTDARRIYREIKVMAHFSHPNIVPLLEVVKPRDSASFRHIYLISELSETDLHRVIHSRQDLTSDHIAYFTYQTLCALKHIHAANVLHRDLKPSNLLVNADCTLRMCDFGLARESDSSLSQALTEYVVTRWYRAPEVLLSGGRYTSAIDVWSAGCVLAELLLRRPLFPGENYLHQLQLITQTLGSPSDEDLHFVTAAPARAFMLRLPKAEAVPWASLMPHVRGPVLDLLARCLTFDPDKRITVEEALAHPFLARVRAARKHVNEDVPAPKPFKLRVPGGSAGLKAMPVEVIKARFYAELCGVPLTPSPSASPFDAMAGGAFGQFGPMPSLAPAAAPVTEVAVVAARPPATGPAAAFPQPPRGYPVPLPGMPATGLRSMMPQPPPGYPGPGGAVPRPYGGGPSAYAGVGGPRGPAPAADTILGSPSRAARGGVATAGGALSRSSAFADADMGGVSMPRSPAAGHPHHRTGGAAGAMPRGPVEEGLADEEEEEDMSDFSDFEDDEEEVLPPRSAAGARPGGPPPSGPAPISRPQAGVEDESMGLASSPVVPTGTSKFSGMFKPSVVGAGMPYGGQAAGPPPGSAARGAAVEFLAAYAGGAPARPLPPGAYPGPGAGSSPKSVIPRSR